MKLCTVCYIIVTEMFTKSFTNTCQPHSLGIGSRIMISVSLAHDEKVSEQLENGVKITKQHEGQAQDMTPLNALNQTKKLIEYQDASKTQQPAHDVQRLMKQKLKQNNEYLHHKNNSKTQINSKHFRGRKLYSSK